MDEHISEHEAQCAVIEWARWREKRWKMLEWLFAVPNGAKLSARHDRRGKRYSPEAIKLLKEGLTPGVSDLFLPYPNGERCGLFIEMKSVSGKLSPDQIAFIDAMNARGYHAVACWGSEQAIREIARYIGMEDSALWEG